MCTHISLPQDTGTVTGHRTGDMLHMAHNAELDEAEVRTDHLGDMQTQQMSCTNLVFNTQMHAAYKVYLFAAVPCRCCEWG